MREKNRRAQCVWITSAVACLATALSFTSASAWEVVTIDRFTGTGVPAAAFTHLPDGRVLVGVEGRLRLQTAWGEAASVVVASAGVRFDPSLLSAKDENTALLGDGGFMGPTGVRFVSLSGTTPSVGLTPSASIQNYAAAWRPSAIAGHAGWIIAGTNQGTTEATHNLTWLSADGTKNGALTGALSTYSSGMAVDAAGNVFAALYELSGSPSAANSNVVVKFTTAEIDQAITALLVNAPAPLSLTDGERIHRFESPSTLAVDDLGRLWAGGYGTGALEVYDPRNGAAGRVLVTHGLPNETIVTHYAGTFTRLGVGYVAFMAHDSSGTPGTDLRYGWAPSASYKIMQSPSSWRRHFFGDSPAPAQEPTLWGHQADPDADGLPNIAEYTFGTDPLTPNAEPISISRDRRNATITLRRDDTATGVDVLLETSTSLSDDEQSWQPLPSSPGQNTWEAELTEARYFRARVTLNDPQP